MPLPDNLERLKHISIDTLGLSDSTIALLKWYGITHIADCIEMFYRIAHERNEDGPWPRYIVALFAEVKPALIAAGYWELVLDAEVSRAIYEQIFYEDAKKVIQWAGRDIDLHQIQLEGLGLSDSPYQYKTVGKCIEYILIHLRADSQYWLDLGSRKDSNHRDAGDMPLGFHAYTFGVLYPRLVELGYWPFVEAHLDDF